MLKLKLMALPCLKTNTPIDDARLALYQIQQQPMCNRILMGLI